VLAEQGLNIHWNKRKLPPLEVENKTKEQGKAAILQIYKQMKFGCEKLWRTGS